MNNFSKILVKNNFFIDLVKIIDFIGTDKYFCDHKKYYTKEMRVVIYSQYLESYKTVTLENMSKTFGVSL